MRTYCLSQQQPIDPIPLHIVGDVARDVSGKDRQGRYGAGQTIMPDMGLNYRPSKIRSENVVSMHAE